MTQLEIESRIRSLLAEYVGVRESDIKPSTTFADLGIDSLDGVEVAMLLREEFGCETDDARLEQIKTVGAATRYACELAGV